ncbi:hypothetical protein V8C86DRAFT_2936253 [Haematococcus lacustris]
MRPATTTKARQTEPERSVEAAATKEQCQGSAKKRKERVDDEIDAIFGSAKCNPVAHQKSKGQQQQQASVKQVNTQAPVVLGNKDDIFGEETKKGRKRTEEGYAVYTEEELGLGRPDAGNTDLCPFDCECCF